MRTFYIERLEDVSGVSGTGIVAYGCVFNDGTTVIRWEGDKASTVVWESLEVAEHVHGHGGKTRIVFTGETEDA